MQVATVGTMMAPRGESPLRRWTAGWGVLALLTSGCDVPAYFQGGDVALVAAVAQVIDDDSEQHRVGSRALDLISYDWQHKLPGWTVEFTGPRPSILGVTLPHDKHIEIYVRTGQSVFEVAFTLAHELGHAVDITYNTAAEREAWLAARSIAPGHDWWTGSGQRDFEVGSGDFAETFAVWQLREHGRVRSHSPWGLPSRAELVLLAQLAQ